MASYIVLLGPPGVGKGTQAAILAQKTGLQHISSGELFRENMKNRTDLGRRAQSYMDEGELVPDDLTVAMVQERIMEPDCEAGAILDGFPRTPAQAVALNKMLAERSEDVDVVPFISAGPDILIERMSGRLTCRAEGHVYHEKLNPPKVAGKCDLDGSELLEREDDNAETIRRRIRVYTDQTSPLIDYYRAEGKLVEIDGSQSIESVTAALMAAIGK